METSVKEPESCRHYPGANEFCYEDKPRICDKSDWENCPFYERGDDGGAFATLGKL